MNLDGLGVGRTCSRRTRGQRSSATLAPATARAVAPTVAPPFAGLPRERLRNATRWLRSWRTVGSRAKGERPHFKGPGRAQAAPGAPPRGVAPPLPSINLCVGPEVVR
jgi:hypothetical protein